MFEGWGFLLGEVWVLIAFALLLGLLVGWLIWGRRETTMVADSAEADRLRVDLQAEKARCKACDAKVANLEAQLAAATAAATTAAMAEPARPAAAATETASAASDDEAPAPAAPEAPEAAEEPGVKPSTLDAPRDGAPDDLKRIKGIGPKLEQLCNRLGFWHFDQIANWSADEIAWVDANLESFKGRVTRDNWVAQARVLAAEKA